MSDPVLSQLVSVESDLAQQADSLESQLAQIQARREGLRTVIDMFEGGDEDSEVSTTKAAPTPTTARKPGRPPGSKTTRKAAVAKTPKSTTKQKPGRQPKSSTASAESARNQSD